MLKSVALLFISIFALTCFSCKNGSQEETNSQTENSVIEGLNERPRAPKKDLTPEEIAVTKSVMTQIMGEPQLKNFASYLVSAGLTDTLFNNEGPFIVFGPENAVIEALSDEKIKFYSNPENKDELKAMLTSHIVLGEKGSEDLMQTIAKKRKMELKTLSGTKLILTKSGEAISVSNGKGKKANLLKEGIGSNGTYFVVDGLMHVD